MAGTGGWLQYREIAPTRARQAESPGIIETLEGPVAYAAGDYICPGVEGECWPLKREYFEADYLLNGEIDAEGWGLWQRRGLIWARQRRIPFIVQLENQRPLYGQTNDWEARNGPGRHWVIGKDVFAASYSLGY